MATIMGGRKETPFKIWCDTEKFFLNNCPKINQNSFENGISHADLSSGTCVGIILWKKKQIVKVICVEVSSKFIAHLILVLNSNLHNLTYKLIAR